LRQILYGLGSAAFAGLKNAVPCDAERLFNFPLAFHHHGRAFAFEFIARKFLALDTIGKKHMKNSRCLNSGLAILLRMRVLMRSKSTILSNPTEALRACRQPCANTFSKPIRAAQFDVPPLR